MPVGSPCFKILFLFLKWLLENLKYVAYITFLLASTALGSLAEVNEGLRKVTFGRAK